MNNCIILGSGRSGTSMIAGFLHKDGYFLGDRLYKSRDSSPKGFFERKETKSINEQILSRYNQNRLNLSPLHKCSRSFEIEKVDYDRNPIN